VVVAVVFVRTMQPPLDQVVDVITVRDGVVSAAFAVRVRGIATDGVGVAGGVHGIDCDHVLVDVPLVGVVQVAVVQKVDVIVVAHGGVAATVSVFM
jgi:hypothetical protein